MRSHSDHHRRHLLTYPFPGSTSGGRKGGKLTNRPMAAISSFVLFGRSFCPSKSKSSFSVSKSPHPNTFNGNLTFSGSTNISSRFVLAASPFDLVPPPIDHDLLETMAVAGAQASDDGTVETFGNDDLTLDAAYNGVVVVDLSHFGRIRVTGEDRIKFLHNQTTANFENLHEGQGCDTVFVTPTARTIDIAHAWVMRNAITVLVSAATCKSIIEMLNKYIFFTDKVEIQDITKQTCFYNLIGPKSNQVMEDLNLGNLVGQPYGTHCHYSVNGAPITVAVGSVLSDEGFSLLLSPSAAESVWKTLLKLGSIPMGTKAWERLRVLQGRPAPGKELTNEFNVLEAGLWRAISTNKGCYKGQETIARLITYDGVKQRLWGVHLSAAAEPGSPIVVGDKKVGQLTSCAIGREQGKHIGLGYVKKKAGSAGDVVHIGDVVGKLVSVPYLTHTSHIDEGS